MSKPMMTPEQEQIEREANLFAMCLLMPESLLRPDVENLLHTSPKFELEEFVEVLADKYKVSPARMTLRLGQLGIIG